MIIDADLPEIAVVKHARAKRLKLAVSPKGIRLTIPPLTTQRQIHFFVAQSKDWLKQTWAKYQLQAVSVQQTALPDQIHLCYLDQVIDVSYQPISKAYQYQAKSQQLIVNEACAEQALTQFIIRQAEQILPGQLLNYAEQHRLTVNKVRIARPTTRWGSCSHDQCIMLHAGLLLMSKQDADYVLLHELAHTKHMHHQADFWFFLEHLYPHAKAGQKRVKAFRLPAWWQSK
ncbi:SprT family zinc-dependent metalloprotease [Acinetobacter puyangensis]|uniref:YgjP-like metallopeptidase domain-containing protein n=1 Tax=Acinetobacter puyangensis TaxID=1096779 RepID=A0A240E9K7_9GAMM|nr:YgjP-like metallopeptidase domain-containing protein [Acinetobacter puyangensis]SNX44913.1 hypothetical protein SAMN05421731_104278 [Acinetobacter puyangensis]